MMERWIVLVLTLLGVLINFGILVATIILAAKQ